MLFFILLACLLATINSSPLQFPGSKPSGRVPNPCSTNDGTQCVFPFTYADVEHYHCTYASSPTPWCATRVDSNGTVVTNSWGDCSNTALSSCPVESIAVPSCVTDGGPQDDVSCVFPFRHLGVTYTSCTTTGKDMAWCSTNTTSAGEHIEEYYGHCPSTCPGAENNTSTTTIPSTTASTTATVSTTSAASTTTSASTTTTSAPTTATASSTTTDATTTTTTAANAGRFSSSCPVVSGPALGKQCVFPFTFYGVTYTGCADWEYGGQYSGKRWCSTRTDSEGEHVDGQGEYGMCAESCKKNSIDISNLL